MYQKDIVSKKRAALRSDERHYDLVLAAYYIIAEKGFEGLRVRDVAARARVNIATLHYYFNSKEDLIRGVVDYMLHLFLTINAPVPDGVEVTAAQKLRQLFLNLQYQLQQAPQLFIVFTELHLRAQRDPVVRAILKSLNDRWQAHIEAICAEGVRQGIFRPNIEPYRTASEVIALIKGISLQAVSQLDTFKFERIAIDVEQWLSNPSAKTSIIHRGRKGT